MDEAYCKSSIKREIGRDRYLYLYDHDSFQEKTEPCAVKTWKQYDMCSRGIPLLREVEIGVDRKNGLPQRLYGDTLLFCASQDCRNSRVEDHLMAVSQSIPGVY